MHLGEVIWNGSIAISLFIFLNLFEAYNEERIPLCPQECGIDHVHIIKEDYEIPESNIQTDDGLHSRVGDAAEEHSSSGIRYIPIID